MNNKHLLPAVVLILALISCKNEAISKIDFESIKTVNNAFISDFAIDSNNHLYYVTSEFDTTIAVPLYSSFIPMKYKLIKQESPDGAVEIMDHDFLNADEILFDVDNALWVRTRDGIIKKTGDKYQMVYEGNMNFIAADGKNNIWAGGFNTGLIKIDRDLNISQFTVDNSAITTNSITAIHIDKNDGVWVSLWDNQGILKVDNGNFTIYNSNNSTITSQDIWCIVSDKNDNIWIGTGHDNDEISLMKFDGVNWIIQNPEYKGKMVKGTVRKLCADGDKIYVVSVKYEKDAFRANSLLTFDGISWEKLNIVPEEIPVVDIVMDYYRKIVWINSNRSGLYKMEMK